MTAPGTTPVPATGWWVKRSVKAFPEPAELVLTGGTPDVLPGTALTPSGASLTLTGGTPTVRGGTVITPDPATLLLTGHEPTIVAGTAVQPAGATLTLTGGTPVLETVLRPAGATLTLTGGTPSILQPITDDFNRANAATLGANWVDRAGGLSIDTNTAIPDTVSTINFASHVTTLTADDMEVSITLGAQVSTGTDSWWICLGANTSGQMAILAPSGANIVIFSATSWALAGLTSRDSVAGTWTTGDIFTLRRIGNVYTADKNGSAIVGLSWTDSTDIVPRDSSHRLVAIGSARGAGAQYRRIDSFTATAL